MGICISKVSSEIHNADSIHGHQNAVVFTHSQTNHKHEASLSLYSREGAKCLNQDSAIIYQGFGSGDGVFGGVFDGHGPNGHVVSEFVRNRLPLLLLSQKESVDKVNGVDFNDEGVYESFRDKTIDTVTTTDLVDEDSRKWKEAITSSFKVLDKEIKLLQNFDFSCSGTTAVVTIRKGEDLIIANLGDSRAILGTRTENNEIKAVQLTTDLKPSIPSEADRIRSCNGRVLALKNEPHIERVWLPMEDAPGLAMSRSFGDFLLKDHGVISVPDVTFHRLTPNDQFMVLATDGVWDVLSNNEVACIVLEAKSEEEAARGVVEGAMGAWKRKFPSAKVDDCTAVCLFFHHHGIFR
ncbi:probable protein phosphatase 2C 72 isoform X1 [Cannabis sativa]|uniref:probable protein phosphatase 2C 72 isoform X1 n=1 Tax=Cannabis sativa TaxID=3483 RepID=UPI0029CA3562|nr:probable protein phosphatase 2C 72 isoform X1 [Cannabis sativa]